MNSSKFNAMVLLAVLFLSSSCQDYYVELKVINKTAKKVSLSIAQCGDHELDLKVLPKSTSSFKKIKLLPKKCDGEFELVVSSNSMNAKKPCYYPHDINSAKIEVVEISGALEVYCDAKERSQ